MAVAKRRLRADAAHNRQQILDAGRAAFASDGLDVSMAEIARRAGVGFATAQRRFPTKDHLLREIIAEELSGMQEAATDSAPANDPWEAFTTSIRTCAAHQALHPGLAGAIAESVSAATLTDPAGHIGSMFTSIAQHATNAGILRHDVTLGDVLAILQGNAGVIAYSPGNEMPASARFVELALRGLRAN
ncbi:TetR/AcrR family transcriptional regulator [Cryobacterium sp. PH31-O1]|uniref:TetR/AcrR family transcriptional regulator n=1 Tax=Cryobacterium sp. PH31-O1 TaxID=3046306 RepID=UPI0024B9C0A2|nr:TetR/AcrR family transcriptional regulator [Cryobacterium sp. PH31-O1]MDJ0337053.1 helix-turn-helix domain-containing protein [Cryobacterium sp. PH31-O1]